MAGKGTISITFKLDGDGKGFRAIAQDANGLRTVMASTLEQSEALKTSLINWSAAVQGLQGVDRAVGQISSQLNAITSESEKFNKAMKEANTMAGKDSTGFKQLKGEVADLAKEIPIARDQLANGLYQTISNGVPEDNWIEFLNTSARSAVGGLADINKVVGVTSTLIKNYGLEWSAAADIQDKIQLTAKNGVTSFEQLSQALPRVTGNAATLGVSIDELMGTFATLTGVSGNTAEVSTQLAAIFTALVKPSSEAAEMAAKMGIQFDAASIKAAGGFQNFLNQLDGSVKAYAQANGVLEQEVYSKLFGSAEAIRALIPLQGELADKFTANVANMVNSAGTMDAAYADMSSHGEAVNQMLRNQWATVIDVVSGITSGAQPYINFTAGLLSTGSSAAILITTFKQLNVQQALVATRAKLASVAMTTLGLRGKSAAATVRVFSSAMKGGAYSATALKIALRGLLIATGIGAAIAAVTTVIEYFVSATDEAAESVEKLDDAESALKATVTNAQSALKTDLANISALMHAHADTSAAVKDLNNKYGEIFGTYQTAAEWQKVLVANSVDYCKALALQAEMEALAAKALKLREKAKDAHERYENLKITQRTKVDMLVENGVSRKDAENSVAGIIKLAADGYEREAQELEKKMQEHADERARLLAKIKTPLGKTPQNEDPAIKPDKVAPIGSIKEIQNRISSINGKIQLEVDPDKRREFYIELEKLEAHKVWMEVGYKYPKLTSADISKVERVLPPVNLKLKTVGDAANEKLDADKFKMPEKAIDSIEVYREGLEGIASTMGSLSGMVDDSAAAWLNWGQSLLNSIASAIPAINALILAKKEEKNAEGQAAVASAANSAAKVPVVGAIMAVAAIASVTAALANIPKFANGGIAYGPTLGVFGEYAGASNNPEVVAPLDKLRALLQPVEGFSGGTVKFKIDGRTLVGILEKETNLKLRS